MRDFKRIGGEILSSPLNENFRKLRNDISIANSNLVFSDKYGIMATVKDMEDLIDNPSVELTEGQACYVVSSGELYRFSELDDKWHKIADFGQTFRQAFLNSGAVLVEKPIEVSTDYLIMPRMLVYFKNKPGEDPYLKGMYLIDEYTLEVQPSSLVEKNTMYSIYVDYTKQYHIEEGLPKSDDPNYIFIGAFALNNNTLAPELVYTMPDIAYTADRGGFFVNGGQCSGGELYSATTNMLSRKFGLYYDEGVNYPGASYYVYNFNSLEATSYTITIDDNVIGYFTVPTAINVLGELDYFTDHPDRVSVRQNDLIVASYPVNLGSSVGDSLAFTLQNSIDNYPKTLDDTSNYNVAEIPSLGTVADFLYTTTTESITNLQINNIHNLIYNKYKGNTNLEDVPNGYYTIQKHYISPTGQNIMVYGDEVYEYYNDAESHLNDSVELDAELLAAEVTRVIVQNPEEGESFDPYTHCTFFTVNRLTQVGTISPVFADDEFKLYLHDDPTPTFLRFDLSKLRNPGEILPNYILYPDSYQYTQNNFFDTKKYDKGSAGATVTTPVQKTNTATHEVSDAAGYIVPSKQQFENMETRANNIESEIWKDYQTVPVTNPATPEESWRNNQGIRYRLYKLENDIYNKYSDQSNSSRIRDRLDTAETDIDKLEHYKANKLTTINGKTLGDINDEYTPKEIVLITNDINEPANAGVNDHRWFSEQLVRNTD